MTRVRKKSVLLGCRDAGSAYNLVEAVKFHRYKPRFDIQIFCQSPAYEIFKREGLDPIHVEPAVNDRALSLARKIIQQVKPDAILTGVSGPDIGIDEALIASSQHDNTYVFQDFWGYINRSSKHYAKHYFVIDKEAKRLTHLLYPNLSTDTIGTVEIQ